MSSSALREAAERSEIEQQLAGVAFSAAGRPLKPCGTLPAYRRHLKAREVPCQPCCDANAAIQRKYRPARTKKAAANTECGTPGGYYRHLRRRQKPCLDCALAHAKELREYRRKKKEGRTS